MPVLAAWIGSLFTSLVSFLTIFLTKEIALRVAAVAAVVGFTAALMSGIALTLSAIAQAVPSSITIAASWLLPSNTAACLGAIITTATARWVYDWQTKIVALKVG